MDRFNYIVERTEERIFIHLENIQNKTQSHTSLPGVMQSAGEDKRRYSEKELTYLQLEYQVEGKRKMGQKQYLKM